MTTLIELTPPPSVAAPFSWRPSADNMVTMSDSEQDLADLSERERQYLERVDPMDAPFDQQPDLLISRQDGQQYWEAVPADVNGMLGDIPKFAPNISRTDLQGSRAFLARLGIGRRNGRATIKRVLEGGAGIGRVTLGLLTDVAEQVDVIEPVTKFTAALEGAPGVGLIMNQGMEDWQPQEGVTYGLIWNQHCVGHLTDAQLAQYLRDCASVLEPGGYIVIKENVSKNGHDVFDVIDSSVTRDDGKFLKIFCEAGLRLVRKELQKGLPTTLYPIRMYALQP